MGSLLNSGLVNPASGPISLSALGNGMKLHPPFSLGTVLGQVQSKTFHADIETPDLEALGGSVDLTIFSDGNYHAHVHMHDSGITSYDFRVVIVFTAASDAAHNPLVLALDTSGSVEGTDKTTFTHAPNRDFDTDLNPTPSQILQQFWFLFQNGQLGVSKAYSHAGILGAAENAIKDYFVNVASLIFGAAIVGLPPIAGAIYFSSMLGGLNVRFLGESGLVGLIASAGEYILAGPEAMFPVFVAAGLVFELGGPSHRSMTQPERDFANQVFKGTIDFDKIVISDMVGLASRPFTVPGMDGSVIINIGLGNYFTDLSKGVRSEDQGKLPGGYYIIHELTHAWQIQNGSWQGYLCDEAIIYKDALTDNSLKLQYTYGSADGSWGDFSAEQKACIVADWFAGIWLFSRDHAGGDPRKAMDPSDPYFKFISGHIWMATN